MRVEVRLRPLPLHSCPSYPNLFPLAVKRLAWTPETIQARKHTLCAPRRDLDRACDIVDTSPTLDARTLLATYISPEHLCPEGPRLDNDHADIHQISVGPSHSELVSSRECCWCSSPHRPDCLQRLPDVQSRLLREKLLVAIFHSLYDFISVQSHC